ncbi:Sec23 protein, putative [Entamoeba nuttalli P19]|uniref:Protein transport protein SEC23 n=2 Tax=Entamoeba nuttalli TaxID=412467 RepID=K2H5D4_ENTNP|nr:Sec23 protein, putative [Entamoeba nuttalli P19]EKE41607.1 Sec23 protein, putative [Entamoeba nuttalli P19]|eukprot:XP_008856062.1 Sec23 protein, putative [Entamoeba nuttalli P19]
MNIDEVEQRDGIRFTWNTWVSTSQEARKNLHIPIGCLYSPLLPKPLIADRAPIKCSHCGAVINPYCSVDYNSNLWTCCFCLTRNQLQYQNLPELQVTTFEYRDIQENIRYIPTYIFVIDTTCTEHELEELKTNLTTIISLLPPTTRIGLITFGHCVTVHNLMCESDCLISVAFANKVNSPIAIQCGLLLSPNSNQYIIPIEECELTFMSIIESLQVDGFDVPQTERPKRATGAALDIAQNMLKAVNMSGHIIAFVAGPCTEGPGKIIGTSLNETLRCHQDIVNENTPYMVAAKQFYDGVADKLIQNESACTILACSMDQTGLMEMRKLYEGTGGIAYYFEDYTHEALRETLLRLFDGQVWKSNVAIEVQTCKEMKVCGALGPLTSGNKKTSSVSPTSVAVGGTSLWKASAALKNTSYAFIFDVTNPQTNPKRTNEVGFIQFITTYYDELGRKCTRATTSSRMWTNPSQEGFEKLAAGFDQEAATTLMARYAAYKAETEDSREAIRWLDRSLIKMCQRFGDFRKDDPNSFKLSPNFSIYPQFMFHLRRSHFLKVFNCTPDETSVFRATLNRETVNNTLTMIQPTLDSYKYGQQPVPVLLSLQSVKSDEILLLDTYFYLVVFRGNAVAEWMKQKLEEKPEYAGLKDYYALPEEDAKELSKTRIPAPRIYVCNQYSGNQRFLMTILDPAVAPGQNKNDLVFTEDVSLDTFLTHLRQLAVKDTLN